MSTGTGGEANLNSLGERLEQVKALKKGQGLQAILDEAYKILGNPAVLFNMEFQLLAHTKGIVTDDPIWNEIVALGTFYNETTAFLRDEGFTDAVANAKKSVFLISEKLKYDRIYGKILNNDNITVAGMVMVACNKPFEDDDQTVFEAVCDKLGQEAGRSEFFQRYGVLYQEFWIRKLIEESIHDKLISYGHISNLYEHLKANLYFAVADISRCDTKNGGLAAFRQLFKKTQPEFVYSTYYGYIVIIMSTDNDALDVEKDLGKLNKLLKKNNIYVGISSCFDNLFMLRKYYDEAVSALSLGLNNDSTRLIFMYDEVKRTL